MYVEILNVILNNNVVLKNVVSRGGMRILEKDLFKFKMTK